MKLLGWMHRKFRQNNAPGDPFRDFSAIGGQGHPCNCLSGRPSLEDLQPHYPHHAKMPARASLHGMQSHRLFGDDDYYEVGPDQEEQYPAMDELMFHGLLAIGTLGSAPALKPDAGSATPTFGVPPPQLLQLSVDSIIAEKEPSEATESELKAINAELEKVLVPEPGDKNDRLSSARPSHVSLKHLAADVCPLQGYLFGSPVEMAETTESAAERKVHRVSLGELFMRSRMAEEGNGGGGGKKGDDRDNATPGMHLMVKKMLKRRGSKADAASRAGPATGLAPTADAATAETKFHKIMQMFHRKVHPETSAISHKKHAKSVRYVVHADVPGGDGAGAGGEVMLPSAKGFKKDGALGCFKCQSYPPPVPPAPASTCGSDSNGNREYWIKTDADYLVLEL
ncbi:hypothetical protein Taro_013502 [Colocasia esculenta]|uniref:LAZY1 n=1 Tax=Colocasia esculenta TaxID=4460 RepID=A0A843UC81_COLES|nr:hypothetical protein [Colocasia esculenta]